MSFPIKRSNLGPPLCRRNNWNKSPLSTKIYSYIRHIFYFTFAFICFKQRFIAIIIRWCTIDISLEIVFPNIKGICVKRTLFFECGNQRKAVALDERKSLRRKSTAVEELKWSRTSAYRYVYALKPQHHGMLALVDQDALEFVRSDEIAGKIEDAEAFRAQTFEIVREE